MTRLPIPEKLETERLLLRRLRYEDAEEIFYAYAGKPEATKYMSWPTHQTLRDTHAFLTYAVKGWQDNCDFSFSVRLKPHGRLIGGCGLLHDEGKIQFGYILSPNFWGHGLATELCTKLMELIRSVPGILRVTTFVDAENGASARVLLKSGLVEEARLDKWFIFVNQGKEPRDCILFKLPLL